MSEIKRMKERVYHWDKSKQINYLALEGGGGKGIAFLGAIAALEKIEEQEVELGKNEKAVQEAVLEAIQEATRVADTDTIEETVQEAARQAVEKAVQEAAEQVDPKPLINLKGFAGTSAGSIMAFLLAMGYKSKRIAQILSIRQTFIDFYDGPEVGNTRGIIDNVYKKQFSGKFFRENGTLEWKSFPSDAENDYYKIVSEAIDEFPDLDILETLIKGGFLAGMFFSAVTFLLSSSNKDQYDTFPYVTSHIASFLAGAGFTAGGIGVTVKHRLTDKVRNNIQELKEETDSNENTKETPYADLIKQITSSNEIFKDYLKNILLDRGLFPGFAFREFFMERLKEKTQSDENLNFEALYNKFGKELRVYSSNTVTHRPQIFSKENTPDFPVVDAVGMSSSFPFAFKPVLVKDCETIHNGQKKGPPDGYYADGGMIINLPLHLFDNDPIEKELPLRNLNKNMLGLRLEILHPEEEIKEEETGGEMDKPSKSAFVILGEYVGDLIDTMLFPTEEGQIRTETERRQTIEVDVTHLETLQFVPPFKKSIPKIIEAYIKTRFILDRDYEIRNTQGETIFRPANHYYTIDETSNEKPVEAYEFNEDKISPSIDNEGKIKNYQIGTRSIEKDMVIEYVVDIILDDDERKLGDLLKELKK